MLAAVALTMGLSANAQQPVLEEGFDAFTITNDWYVATPKDLNGSTQVRGGVGVPGSNEVIVMNSGEGSLMKVTADGGFATYVSGITGAFDITSDEAGNLIWWTYAGWNNIYVLPAGKTTAADVITMNWDPTSYDFVAATGETRADRMGRVIGDVMSADGGYIFLCSQGQNCIYALHAVEGKITDAGSSLAFPSEKTCTSGFLAQPFMGFEDTKNLDDINTIAGAAYVYEHNGGTQWYPNENFDGWETMGLPKKGSSRAFDWFEINGKIYFVYGYNYNHSGTWVVGDLTIVRDEDKAVVGHIGFPDGTNGDTYTTVKCWANADGSVSLYYFGNRTGAGVFTIKPTGGEPAAPLYAAGQFQGWDPANPVEFTYADGVYSYTFPEGTGKFKMSTKKSTDKDDWNPFNEGAICVADDKRIEDNTGATKYTLDPGGTSDISFGYAEGQWTVNVDLANNQIWATNATNKPAGPKPGDDLYIVGPGSKWDPANPDAFTYDAAKNVYTYAVSDAADGFKISTAKGANTNDWGPFDAAGYHTAAALEANVAVELLPGSPAAGGNITTTVAAPYTVEVSGDFKTITIVSAGEINVPATCCVIGELAAGKWDASKVAPLKLQDDGYTYYGGVEMAGGWFRLCEKAGAPGNDLSGVGTQWGGQINGAEVENNNAVPFIQTGANAFNIVSFDNYPKTLYFTVNFKEMTVTVSDVPAGVESIDADNNVNAEYYNLQGIRVNEPVKGQLYIVRQGSKVSKVIL